MHFIVFKVDRNYTNGMHVDASLNPLNLWKSKGENTLYYGEYRTA